MTYTQRKYLQWILVNGALVALLLSNNEGMFQLGIILGWITAVLGCLFISPELSDKVVEASNKKDEGQMIVVNKYLNYTFDVALTLYFAYIGHPILAAVYAMHIVGIKNLHDAQERAFVNKLKGKNDEQ